METYSWLTESRSKWMSTYTIPRPNMKDIPSFLDLDIFSLHNTGMGRATIEKSRTRMMM